MTCQTAETFRKLAERKCQSASNFDPRSASKSDPLMMTGSDGSARPGGAGLGCAAGASAGQRGAVVWKIRRGS